MSYFDNEELRPPATEAEAHAEWHRNTGVAMGPTGGTCPWDACGHYDPYTEEGEWVEASTHPSYWSNVDDYPEPPF